MCDFDEDINKTISNMGYDSCDEEWNNLRWFFLLSKVKTDKDKDGEKDEKSIIKRNTRRNNKDKKIS